MQPDTERRDPCPQCRSESCHCACIPGWLVVQTAADIEKLIRAFSVQRAKLRSRDFAPLRSASRKLLQDACYMQDFHSGMVRRADVDALIEGGLVPVSEAGAQ